jgi:hypothetical protein
MKRKRVQWSKEPDEAPDFSDWKITLAKKGKPNQSSQTVEKGTSSLAVTFSVHRNLLGTQSEYFNRIFKLSNSVAVLSDKDGRTDLSSSSGGGFSESKTQHSFIDLPSNISDKSFGLIVKAFEALLDYCYVENFDLNGTSPIPLLFLCDYFQMEDDFESQVIMYSENLIKETASKLKLHLLYADVIEFRAAGLNVEHAQNLISRECSLDKILLSSGMQLAVIADLPLWLNVVFFINNPLKKCSKYWSTSVANFLVNINKSSAIDSNSFQKLTDENVLPYVNANAALVLLKEEQKYGCPEAPFSDDSDSKLPKLTNLQERCVKSLIEAELERNETKEYREKLRQRVIETMYSLPHVMGTYLNRTLDSYDEERTTLSQQIKAKTDRLKKVEDRLKTDRKKYRGEIEVKKYRLKKVDINTYAGSVEKIRQTIFSSNAPKNINCTICDLRLEKLYISDCCHIACLQCVSELNFWILSMGMYNTKYNLSFSLLTLILLFYLLCSRYLLI